MEKGQATSGCFKIRRQMLRVNTSKKNHLLATQKSCEKTGQGKSFISEVTNFLFLTYLSTIWTT